MGSVDWMKYSQTDRCIDHIMNYWSIRQRILNSSVIKITACSCLCVRYLAVSGWRLGQTGSSLLSLCLTPGWAAAGTTDYTCSLRAADFPLWCSYHNKTTTSTAERTDLSKAPQQQLCRWTQPVEEDLWDKCHRHLQHSQQTDRQVEAGGTDLEPGWHVVRGAPTPSME